MRTPNSKSGLVGLNHLLSVSASGSSALAKLQEKMAEQDALLRSCRSALDDLLSKKPSLGGLFCGHTSLGNLKADLYEYKPVDPATAQEGLAAQPQREGAPQ